MFFIFQRNNIFFSIFYNWDSVTRGPYGITGIPSPRLFGCKVSEVWQFCVLGLVFSAAAVYVFRKIYASPFGRTLKAIRDDELLAVALGKNAAKFKVSAFVIAGGIAAMITGFFAIKVLLVMLNKNLFFLFGIYCTLMGAAVMILSK